MLNNISIGSYYPVQSRIHDMNPMSKILSLILFIIINFLCNNIIIMLLISIMSLIILKISKLPFKFYFKTIKGLRVLILFIIILYAIMRTDIFDILCMILRLINIVLYSSILTLTTTSIDLTIGLKKILKPLKCIGIPVNKMALSIALALRFIPTIIDQGNKILKSQASRGIDYYSSKINGKAMAIKSMILPMFILTIRRADNLAESMQVRLYDVNANRTSINEKKWNKIDTNSILIHICILIIIIIKRVFI